MIKNNEKSLHWDSRPEEEKQKWKHLQNRIESLYDYADLEVGKIKDKAHNILGELSSGDVPEYDWEDEIEKEVEDLIEYLSKQLGTLY
jgi:hypothetical protein